MKRLWYFLLGFITAFVVLFGTLFGVGYYFYTEETFGWFANKAGIDVGQYVDPDAEMDVTAMTIKQIVADVSKTNNDFGNMSLNDLQKRYGLKFAKMFDNVFPMPEMVFNVPINKLASQEGLNTIVDNTKFDYVFRLAPDLLGDVAQSQLKDKEFGLLRNGQFEQFFTGVQMGSFLQTPYDYDARQFVIGDPKNPTLTEAISVADIGILYGKLTGNDADVLAAAEYVLKDVKLKRVITGKDELFKEKTFGDVFVEKDGVVSISIDEFIKDVYLGDILGYTPVYLADGTTIDYWKDAQGAKVDTIMTELANIKGGEIIDGTINMDKLVETFGDAQIGKILGYKNVDGVWIDKDTNIPADGIVKVFADLKISEMQSETLQSKISTVKISDIIECKTGLMKALANSTIGSIQTDVMDIKIGTILDYNYGKTTGLWSDKKGNVVSGIIAAVADLTPQTLSTGINKISIGTVLGMYQKDGVWYKDQNCTIKATGINAVLAKYTVGGDTGISVALDQIKLGEIMGLYQGKDNKWYNDEKCTIPAENLSASVADLTFATFTADKIETIVKDLKVGDIFDTEGSKLFSLISNDTNIENLPSAMQNAMEEITVQDAMDLNIIELDSTAQTKLNSIFNPMSINWKTLKLKEFLSALINAIPVL
ncbi:MAG: hypothetical protein IKA42_00085 [Clostridia bacterium]|nr:hypothetical protein [Clostridia bacterium]